MLTKTALYTSHYHGSKNGYPSDTCSGGIPLRRLQLCPKKGSTNLNRLLPQKLRPLSFTSVPITSMEPLQVWKGWVQETTHRDVGSEVGRLPRQPPEGAMSSLSQHEYKIPGLDPLLYGVHPPLHDYSSALCAGRRSLAKPAKKKKNATGRGGRGGRLSVWATTAASPTGKPWAWDHSLVGSIFCPRARGGAHSCTRFCALLVVWNPCVSTTDGARTDS